ncbi:putative myosin ATPase [Helianthus debilis subsp. tardiflorus]
MFEEFIRIRDDKQTAQVKLFGDYLQGYTFLRSMYKRLQAGRRGSSSDFYMLCVAPPETNCYEVANIDDGREYLETRNAMDVVRINQDEQDVIFHVVAVILHLRNVDFIKGKEFDSSKVKDEKSLCQQPRYSCVMRKHLNNLYVSVLS